MTIRKSIAGVALAGAIGIGTLLSGGAEVLARHNPPFVPTRPTINLQQGEAVPVHCLSGKSKARRKAGEGYLVGCV